MQPNECTTGRTVWAPLGSTGWRPATILAVSGNRVKLVFESGIKSNGTRPADCLRPRDAAKNGKDKPPKFAAVATCDRV